MQKEKLNRNNKGITLIALIITIIVMLILVGVSVTVALNGGLFSTAKDAADRYEAEKVNEEKMATEEYIQGIRDSVTGGGSNEPEVNVALNPSGTIPEGAVYYKYEGELYNYDNGMFYTDSEIAENNATAYEEGDTFPETLELGDTYIYNGYMYVYGAGFDWASGGWNEYAEGWGVLCTSGDGDILETINSGPIKYMDYTFFETSIDTAPAIPDTVERLYSTFGSCTDLLIAPTIPASVKDLRYAFSDCGSLTGSITINATPTYYDGCLSGTGITEILGDCENKEEILATVNE